MQEVDERLSGRFDVGHEFYRETLFPCVETRPNGRKSGFLLKAIYSSKRPSGTTIEFDKFPLGAEGRCWHIQRSLCRDVDSTKAIVAALDAAKAVPGCYLYSNMDESMDLRGCSLGLAVVAAVLGLPKFAYTGWVSVFGVESNFAIGAVDGTTTKVDHCVTEGIPIFLARRHPENVDDEDDMRRSALGRYYSFKDFMAGVPFMTREHRAVECETLAEVILLALAIAQQSVSF